MSKNRIKPSNPNRWKYFFLGIVTTLVLLVMAGIGAIAYAYFSASWASRGRIFTDINALPKSKVGLVFGTSDRFQGRGNRYFNYRIEAAVKLWNAGKLETLIVSGDNRSHDYNEPEKMKAALIKHGVPKERIVCDFAGLRTLDSVVRAKEVFGVEQILFISQHFQNERAIYLAKAHRMDARAFDAQDVEGKSGLRVQFREVGARVKMWMDIHLLKTRPHHLGEKISLPK